MNTKRSELIEFDEISNDPRFTVSVRVSFILCLLIALLVCPGLIFVALRWGKSIDAFMHTNTGALVIIGILSFNGVAWLVWRIKKKLE